MIHRRHKRMVSSLARHLHRLRQAERSGSEDAVTELAAFHATLQTVAMAMARGNDMRADQFALAVESESRTWPL
jgi:hypothetical protein